MARKARKYYKPHTREAKKRIAEGQSRYQQRVREALALAAKSEETGGGR
jgi:hypothetical protein